MFSCVSLISLKNILLPLIFINIPLALILKIQSLLNSLSQPFLCHVSLLDPDALVTVLNIIQLLSRKSLIPGSDGLRLHHEWRQLAKAALFFFCSCCEPLLNRTCSRWRKLVHMLLCWTHQSCKTGPRLPWQPSVQGEEAIESMHMNEELAGEAAEYWFVILSSQSIEIRIRINH